MAWTLWDAREAFASRNDVVKTVVIDSDSDEILEMARAWDSAVSCHIRREALAGDRVAKMDVIREVLEDTSRDGGHVFDGVIDLDITSPLRTAEDVEGAWDVFCQEVCEVVYSVVPARRNPYFNMVEQGREGRYALCKSGNYVGRQQAPPVYDLNASIYVYRPDALRSGVVSPARLDGRIYLMRDYHVIDIDTEDDLAMMELLVRHGGRFLAPPLRRKTDALLAE